MQYEPLYIGASDSWYWYDQSQWTERTPENLPRRVFAKLTGGTPRDAGNFDTRKYDTKEEALADLASTGFVPTPEVPQAPAKVYVVYYGDGMDEPVLRVFKDETVANEYARGVAAHYVEGRVCEIELKGSLDARRFAHPCFGVGSPKTHHPDVRAVLDGLGVSVGSFYFVGVRAFDLL